MSAPASPDGAPAAPIRHDLDAAGMRLSVLEWNPSGRSTILCVHGFLDLARGFTPVAERIAAVGYRVLAHDLRGHGDSGRVGDGAHYHFPDHVADLVELIDAMVPAAERERLQLVGHSLGGAVCAFFTAARPTRVRRLALLEGVWGSSDPLAKYPKRFGAWLDSLRVARGRPQKSYATVEEAAERIRANDPLCSRELALFLAEHGTRATPTGRVFKHDPMLLTRPAQPLSWEIGRAFWSQIACPALLVDGGASTWRTELPELEQQYACFPRARRVVVEGAGHMMLRHRPDEIARLLVEFLAEPDGAA